jgi:hypothetical protein
MLIAGVQRPVGKFARNTGNAAELEAGQRATCFGSNGPIHVIDECQNVAKKPTRIPDDRCRCHASHYFAKLAAHRQGRGAFVGKAEAGALKGV